MYLYLKSADEAILNFVDYKKFNSDFRKEYFTLQIVDTKVVNFKADSTGLVGVVGFAQTFLFKKKSDGQLSTGDVM
jgi:hypothetical protein